MYTKRNYSLRDMLRWTRYDIYRFILIALIPIILYYFLNWKWLHLPWLPIALIGTAVAFIIGFKNNASYGRLWEARMIWGGIVNASRSWTIMVKDFITNEFSEHKISEEELNAIKKELVYRHIGWITALRHQMRESRPWEIFMTIKANKEYRRLYDIPEKNISIEDDLKKHLFSEELSYIMKKSNKATQILSLQSKQLKTLKLKGLIDDFRHMEMEKMLVEFYTLQGKSERIKNFPYPRQFATLNRFFVWIFIFLLPFGIMHEFDKIGMTLLETLQENHMAYTATGQKIFEIIAKYFIWLSLPFSVIVAWVFHTMERIGETSENPFEGNANDVPISTIANGIEIDIKEMIDDENLPEKLKPKYDVQM
ncbi:bestrophin family ion channel [Yeosuana sp. MJ-SS3]|uniref:Bestrophin family ion channel n=1 Tax=Gilvirhabdus luticola TaxID=3079858 RepID=A0ABU3U3K9_9FLAO|nr:bestrophin family ion channel [Yeosuana sp. MJ-SS3]MDU8884988.1 bestrophin family ion channel [Yeosuana sp. MJ-SS3]